MNARLQDKVIIVTGVASRAGIGWAIAERLASEGAHLILTDIHPDGAAECANTIASTGGQALGLVHDVTNEQHWNHVVEKTLDRFGRVDALVNNAGIADLGRIEDVSVASFRRQLDINLTSAFLGCSAAVAAMRRHGEGGAIINMSSVAGIVGFQAAAAYSASKGGLRMMTKSIAIELAAEGIRCNSVHPGSIETEMLQAVSKTDPLRHEAIIASLPMHRLGKTQDIAACVAYLASDEASYVTGAEFVIDGGLSAQ